MAEESIVDLIYEAGFHPSRWPEVLDRLSGRLGAQGGIIFTVSESGADAATSPGMEAFYARYVAEGWMTANERGAPMIGEQPPGFITDTDYRTEAEMAAMPVYRDLLRPLGLQTGAGTLIQGGSDDLIVMTLEGFASDTAVRAVLPTLDALRPHLARSLTLSTRRLIGAAQIAVDTMDLLAIGAAVVRSDGHLRAANHRFEEMLEKQVASIRGRLRFASPTAQQGFAEALMLRGTGGGASTIVVPPADGQLARAVHMIPLRNASRDLFEADGFLLLVSDGRNQFVPEASLLKILFDLTPAEARIARHLIGGMTLAEAAAVEAIAYSTARVHLKAIFGKTGCSRQVDLVRLGTAYTLPGAIG